MSPSRAPFIWTPRQPIAADFITSMKEATPRDEEPNRWFLFRTVVDLAEVPDEAQTSITVDGRYLLYVNGQWVGRGPVRCSPLAQRFDSYDLAPALVKGRNVVAVLIHTYGVDTAFYEGVQGMWRPVLGEGGLWVDGPVVDTRRPWRCIQTQAWEQDVPRTNASLGFIESLDANAIPAQWLEPGFNDGGWDAARVLVAGGGGPDAMYGGWEVQPFPVLMPRGIPALFETFVAASRACWVQGQVPQPELPIHRRLYEEPLVPVQAGQVDQLEHLFQGAEGHATVRTLDGADTAFTLDFGRIFSGYPAFEIEAVGGEVIEIACSERLPGEWGRDGVAPGARIERRPYLGNDAHLCRYVARPGVQQFQRFEWCAIRYMHVVVRNAPQGVRVRRLGAVETYYPVAERGRFECSDPMLTTLWQTGAYTVKQCMHDAWEDCPSREQRQWLGDVTVENVAAWAAFGNSSAPLTAKFLRQVAESQRPDGLTQMFAPGDHGHNARLIPDWTLQWILCAADHWALTGDLETMDEIWPSIQKALAWFERIADPSGLVVDMPYWHFMDWAAVGRHQQALALNAQLAGAYRAAATIARAVCFKRASVQYEARAQRICDQLDRLHWDEVRGVWVDMVDPVAGTQDRRVSQHGVAALTLWGQPSDERIQRAFDWAMDPKREARTQAPPVVPFAMPLDEEQQVVMANTFYGHFVGEALARHGRRDLALANIRRRFGPMIEAGSTTLWEAMTPWASLCHGFSASPTYFLSRYVLGVSPAEPGFARVRFSPDLVDLEHAQGIVPVGDRDIEVRLVRTDDGFEATVLGSCETVDVVPASGTRLERMERNPERIVARFTVDARPGQAALPQATSSAATSSPVSDTPIPQPKGQHVSYSIDTNLGELLDKDETRSVLERHLPGIAKHPSIGMARSMTLPAVAKYAAGLITDEALQGIDRDLKALS